MNSDWIEQSYLLSFRPGVVENSPARTISENYDEK